MKNRLKEKLDAGGVAIGSQARFGSSAIAELFGLAGFDFVVIDSEHAPQDSRHRSGATAGWVTMSLPFPRDI